MILYFLKILRFTRGRCNVTSTRCINFKVKYKLNTSFRLFIDKLKIAVPRRNIHGHFCPGMLSGLDIMHSPRFNQGLCFSIEERMTLGIYGLLPPTHRTPDDQVALVFAAMSRLKNPINKHMFMMELLERNEKLFFRILSEYPDETMPLIYTPTVGQACLEYGHLFRRPRGMFITIDDKGYISQVLRNWPEPNIKVICVTDGERILGLGDLGAHGMPIPVGKLCLYTSLGGIGPHLCLPITLDVGTNNEKLLQDPCYVGLRKRRPNDSLYYSFLDEFMEAVVYRYGQNTLIQFEDFANHHAFRLLDRYQHRYCMFNDDIQGTASVAVAGLLASSKITGIKPADYKVLFFGAGEAACGIAHLLVYTMVADGVVQQKALEKIWMVDINGLVVKDRQEPITDSAKYFAQSFKPMKDLLNIVKEVKPNVIIGVSAVGKAFTKEVLHEMAVINKRPVIFALSNPTSKAECSALEAYTHTEARAIFASGSPFDPVEVAGKKFRPGQGNNAYIFPGVGLGILASGMHHVTPEIFLISARTVAEYVSDNDISCGALYPPLKEIIKVSVEMATNIVKYAYEKGLASTYPEPKDKKEYVKKMLYYYFYKSPLPVIYNRKDKSEKK